MKNILINILGIVIYAGPIIPLGLSILLNKTKLRVRLFIVFTTFQILAFMPFLYAWFVAKLPDAIFGLTLPFFTGIFLIILSLIILAYEKYYLKFGDP